MVFEKIDKGIKAVFGGETVMLEAWGQNALRIRAFKTAEAENVCNALAEAVPKDADIRICEDFAAVTNGKIKGILYKSGYLEFYKGGRTILREYTREWNDANEHSAPIKFPAREYKKVDGGYKISVRFEGSKGEKIFGMGQYQQENLDLKGCALELAQRNSQVSIPFYVSSIGYGFLWNNAGIGEVFFGENYTSWRAEQSDGIDYWITADDTPKRIIENYTEVTGRAPKFPDNALGLWQCKLRYRTQEELMGVALEYKKRGIPLDVIVIDYYHWVNDGEWSFDKEKWPSPKAMTKELSEMGVRCMVSVWPTVSRKSCNYEEMKRLGYLTKSAEGSVQFNADCDFYDATNPKAREYVWNKVKENYLANGVDMYWLDACEPEYLNYDFENFEYSTGPDLKVGNAYPKLHTSAFYEGLKESGKEDIVNLTRSAWVGSQKYAALVWSGDIKSNFTALRDQLAAGLNIGLSGIPWWTTDIGGFHRDMAHDVDFTELIIRWYQFAAFCPVLRMHGCRGAADETGTVDLPNEIWSYGEEAYEIMKKYLNIRLEMKEYIKSVMNEASENGSPVMRTMFYEFPEDEKCWETAEQYMFGGKYLVAPVMYEGMREREVYLPKGKWRNIHDGEIFDGNKTITAKAPLDIIPVFEKI